jgi:hypothetical protein
LAVCPLLIWFGLFSIRLEADMKTSELSGAALDWAVATASGAKAKFSPYGWSLGTPREKIVGYHVYLDPPEHDEFGPIQFNPSHEWSQGGPIIERENIGVWFSNRGWLAADREWLLCDVDDLLDSQPDAMQGPTPLVAAMRCYVASKLGDEIEIPSELI